jgi:hypothetical protein
MAHGGVLMRRAEIPLFIAWPNWAVNSKPPEKVENSSPSSSCQTMIGSFVIEIIAMTHRCCATGTPGAM